MSTAPVRATQVRSYEHHFFVSIGIIAAVIILVGFSRTYYLKEFFQTPALLPIIHLHGALFTSWVVLFIAQAWLVSSHRSRIHMRLGIAGFLLAIAMIVVGTTAAITVARLGHVRPGGPPPLVFLVVPIFDMLVFSVLIIAGFLIRRRPDYHKRIMTVATLSLMTAAFGRMIVMVQGGGNVKLALTFTALLVTIATASDAILHRRIHPAFVWAGGLVLLSIPLRFGVAQTDAWMSLARWLTN
jgi:hypothetical protein